MRSSPKYLSSWPNMCAQTVGQVTTLLAKVEPISATTLGIWPQVWPNCVSHGRLGTPFR